MKTTQILIAGFGGQGILFAGKFLAYKGLMEEKQVSWLPSYGTEMRGGTANCNVILSETPVGSPVTIYNLEFRSTLMTRDAIWDYLQGGKYRSKREETKGLE